MADTATADPVVDQHTAEDQWTPPEVQKETAWTPPEANVPRGTIAPKPAIPSNSSQNLPSYAQRQPAVNWGALYGGLQGLDEKLTPDQKTAFAKQDANSDNPQESRARTINQLFVQHSMPMMSPDYIQGNWETVKRTVAKELLGVTPSKSYSDTAFYGGIASMLGAEKEPNLGTELWQAANTPMVNLPSDPKDDSDATPVMGMISGMPFPMTTPAFAAKAWNAGPRQLVEGAETPLGIAGLATGVGANAIGGEAGKALLLGLKGGFTAAMANASANAAPETLRILKDPNASLTEKATAVGQEVVNTVGALAGGLGVSFDLIDPAETKAISSETIGKTPAQAAKVVATHAEEAELPEQKAQLMQTADALHQLDPTAQSGGGGFPGTPQAIPFESPPDPSISGRPVEPIKQAPPPATEAKVETEPAHTTEAASEPVKLEGIKNALLTDKEVEEGRGESKSNQKAVDEAQAVMEKDPQAGAKLVDGILDGSRKVESATDNALLLIEKTRIANERTAAEVARNKALQANDPDALTEANIRVAKARDDYQRHKMATAAAGTPAGQILQSRQMLMAPDYSLASMEAQLAGTNKDGVLTDKQAQEAKELTNRLEDAETKLKESQAKRLADFKKRQLAGIERVEGKQLNRDISGKEKPRPLVLDPEAEKLHAQYERVKQDFDDLVEKYRAKNKPPIEKAMDGAVKWRRNFVLSGPLTVLKLTAAAAARVGQLTAEEGVKGGLSEIPGVKEVAAGAPREGGFNGLALARAYTAMFSNMMRDASDTFKSGKGDIDVLYGDKKDIAIGENSSVGPAATQFFGNLHAALKAPVKRFAFTLSLEKRMAFDIDAGVDVSNPAVQTRNAILAYKEANAAVFLQDNIFNDAWKSGLGRLEAVDSKTGAAKNMVGKVAATAIRIVVPITKVPLNIAAEAIQHATGLATGSIRLGVAAARGFETLTVEQREVIMRELTKGTLGAGGLALLLGYFSSEKSPIKFGGFYQAGVKKKATDIPWGAARFAGQDIPPYLLDNPFVMNLQLGQTVYNVMQSKIRKGDKETAGIGSAMWAGLLGLASETSYGQEAVTVGKIIRGAPSERQYQTGEFAKGLLVPQAINFTATHTDKDAKGNLVKRQPTTVAEHVESGIPGLREKLPERKPERTRKKKQGFVPPEANR